MKAGRVEAGRYLDVPRNLKSKAKQAQHVVYIFFLPTEKMHFATTSPRYNVLGTSVSRFLSLPISYFISLIDFTFTLHEKLLLEIKISNGEKAENYIEYLHVDFNGIKM